MHQLRHAAGDALYQATGGVLAQQLLRHEDVSRGSSRSDLPRTITGVMSSRSMRAGSAELDASFPLLPRAEA